MKNIEMEPIYFPTPENLARENQMGASGGYIIQAPISSGLEQLIADNSRNDIIVAAVNRADRIGCLGGMS